MEQKSSGQSQAQQQQEKKPFQKQRTKSLSEYENEDIVEYFNKQGVSFSQIIDRELTITNSFGFVEKTIEASQNNDSNDRELQSQYKEEETNETINNIKVQATQDKLTKKVLKSMKQENARVFKWKEMLEDFPEKKHPKIKTRGRKGMPDSIRGYAWQILIQGQQHLPKEKSLIFKELLEQQGDKKTIISIFKDVSRTFPQHIFFKDKFGVGQKALFCVLKALAIQEEETGYVQGMGYMAAVLLTYMDMEDAFCCMVGLLKGYDMRDMYMPKMPGLSKAFYIHLSLVKKYMPKLHEHLIEAKFEPSMYGSQWFMTIYSVNFPFQCIVRIWDIFMVEGKKILYRIALAIFKLNKTQLMQKELEGIFDCLREFQKNVDADLLIKTALSFKFSKKLIEKLEKEYAQNPDKDLAKLCQMY